MEYKFVKQVDQKELEKDIRATRLDSICSGVSVVDSLITVTTTNQLSQLDYDLLRSVIVSQSPKTDIEKSVELKISNAISFGQQLMVEVATENVLLKFDSSKVLRMLQKYGHIQSMLMSGSLHTALAAIRATPPDDLVSQERKDKIIGKIEKYLGIK